MRRLLLGLAVLLSLGIAGSAAGLCTCGDRDGCGSAAACSGRIPGDQCGGDRTCKIVVGTGIDLTCCCGCSRGVGPKACNYAILSALEIPAETACGSRALAKLATATRAAVDAGLRDADAACAEQRNALRKAKAARGKLARLRRKIESAAARRKIDGACAASSLALLDGVSARIDEVEAGMGAGSGTTSTTSTTIPSGPSCSATFATHPGDAAEVDFALGCFAAGTDYQGFQLTLNGGRQVTNHLPPPGFACTVRTENATNDSLVCVGSFSVDVQVAGGRVRTSPAPVSNMDASLFVQVGDWRYGPFPTSGP